MFATHVMVFAKAKYGIDSKMTHIDFRPELNGFAPLNHCKNIDCATQQAAYRAFPAL